MAGLLVGIIGGLLAAGIALALGAGAMLVVVAYSVGGAVAMLLFLFFFWVLKRTRSWRRAFIAFIRPGAGTRLTYSARGKTVNRRS